MALGSQAPRLLRRGEGRARRPPAGKPRDGRGKSASHQSNQRNPGGYWPASLLRRGFASTEFPCLGPNSRSRSFPPSPESRCTKHCPSREPGEEKAGSCGFLFVFGNHLWSEEVGTTNVGPIRKRHPTPSPTQLSYQMRPIHSLEMGGSPGT